MSMRVTLALAATLFVLSAAMPAAAFAADDTVVATVNGDKILKKDVVKALSQLPVKDAKVEQVYPFVVEQIINEKLLDDVTAKSKIEETADFKSRMNVIRTQLIRQMFIEGAVKDKISDKAVKSEYEKFKKENKGKEEIHARHILVPTEEEAKQVIKDLEAGAKFEDLASKRSSGPSAQNGGDLGYFTKEDMIPEFSKVAFALKKGTYTKEAVKTQFGWHIIKVEDKRDREVPSLKEVETSIKNKLGQDALLGMVNDLRAKADIKLFDLDGNPAGETDKN